MPLFLRLVSMIIGRLLRIFGGVLFYPSFEETTNLGVSILLPAILVIYLFVGVLIV